MKNRVAPTKEELESLNKIVNSDLIKSIYPMVKKIEVEYSYKSKMYTAHIYVDDWNMTCRNQYERGMDCDYLTDYHILNLFPYIGLPSDSPIDNVLWGPNNEIIC